jgi:hypothetical protein
MLRRDPRPRSSPGFGAALAAALLAGSIGPPVGHAQPAPAEPRPGAELPAGTGSGALVMTPSHGHKVAWLLTGSAVALATLGGVLGYAANSSENDVRDLYVGFAGQPRTFDARTQETYDDLIDQGRRYERLSWASLGLGGAAAAGAAVLFVLGGRSEAQHEAQHARVTPIVTTASAGVAVRF